MLDYWGSISKSAKEVDNELIALFEKKAPVKTLQALILDLRNEKIILNDYSISGWNMFAKKQLYDIILIQLNTDLQKNNNKLKATFCLQNYLNDDIIYKIFNK